jgi:DNA-binding winged helix-turn-helix (wHTH) protein/tetratricopeptide (TPR) repeat protein
MPHEPARCFGAYRLVGPQGPLWCGAQVVAVPPKALAVLWTLVCQAGQVVSKEALLARGWPEAVVSDGVLTSCIWLLRRVLGETPQQLQYIATVHRVGYRFVAPVTLEEGPLAPGPPLAPAAPSRPLALSPPPVVGRQAELAQLHARWRQTLHGVRQTVFITGEAGIGKTTLVETFLAQLPPAPPYWVGRGQCIEHYGAGEAYLPLLDALGQLGRGPTGPPLVATLRQVAPTWLVQLPALCGPDERAGLLQTVQGTTQARMLRELVDALEVLAAVQPLVLVLEDLHWSDASTVEVLALLARRREAARLLVLGTYRPVELILHEHPLKTLKQELVAHGQAGELPLGGLGLEAVATYLAQREDLGEAGRADLAAVVYRRTEGHPLFMVQVVDALAQPGGLHVPDLAAAGPGEEGHVRVVPLGLRELLEAQLGRLGATEQQVLEVGSVAGAEFVVASVAAGLEMAPAAVEAVCEGLTRQGQFLEERGFVEWPDGTVSGRYGWRHALYQEVVYTRLGAGRRARLHRLIGESEEVGYGAWVSEIAAALAMHFERGCDPRRAVRYRQQAAEQALRRYAYREAVEHLTTALELLQTLPETPERAQHELVLQMALGSAAMAAYGETAPTVERAYARACALCQQTGATSQYCAALVGLGAWYATHGQLRTARELLEQALHYGQEAHNPADHARASVMLGSVMFLSGEFVTAQAHLEQGQRLYAPQRHCFHALASPAFGLTRLADVLWHLGYPDQSLQRSNEALHLARSVAHPWEVLVALIFAASVHQHRREVSQTRALAEEALALADEQGFVLRFAQAQILRGWALVMQGHRADGMAQLQKGSTDYRARVTVEAAARYIGLEAEAYGYLGDPSTGLQRLMAVMADLQPDIDRYQQAELLRLRGDLLLQAACWGPEARHYPQMESVETCFRQALAVARQQHAKSLELRAATSLARLWQQQGKRTEAYKLLAPVYSWFSEGFDTADLQNTQALLQALGAPPGADAAGSGF